MGLDTYKLVHSRKQSKWPGTEETGKYTIIKKQTR